MNQLETLLPPQDAALRKAESAYRTISEVAEEMKVPQHVLRFWESRFPEVKPSRMRGSRRYYRPEDIETLKQIKTLLYGEGYTIEGARKVVKGKMPAINAERREQKKAERDMKSVLAELQSLRKMLAAAT